MPAPLDMVRSLLDQTINVKLRDNRSLKGTLHAFDEHCNLVVGNVEETVYNIDENNNLNTVKNELEMLLVRGDQVIYIKS